MAPGSGQELGQVMLDAAGEYADIGLGRDEPSAIPYNGCCGPGTLVVTVTISRWGGPNANEWAAESTADPVPRGQ